VELRSRLDLLAFAVGLGVVAGRNIVDAALLRRGGGCLGGRLLDVFLVIVLFVVFLLLFSDRRVGLFKFINTEHIICRRHTFANKSAVKPDLDYRKVWYQIQPEHIKRDEMAALTA
jgi:uncharacterized membrane protein